MGEGAGTASRASPGGLLTSLRAQGLADAPFDAHTATRRLHPPDDPATLPRDPTLPAQSLLSPLPRISMTVGKDFSSDLPGMETDAPDLNIVGVLGEGGMGTIHLARQRSLQREVAVKVIHREAGVATASAALMGEAVLMGSLEHPNIVPVHALGAGDDGLPVLVMKRISGVAWYELVRDASHPYWGRLGTFSDDRLVAHLEILIQVCNGVHFAHSHGVLHRDIKPENVMIGEYGEVYLVDWGIALRLNSDGVAHSVGATVAGTPGYLAPEMIGEGDDPMDTRTDVYLLGATLHCALTKLPRHSGSTLSQVVVAALRSDPYAYGDEVPAELAAICNRATSARPAERFPTVLAFRQAVSDYLRHRASVALSASAAARLAEVRSSPLDTATTDDRRRLHMLLAECRFGFAQALREWPESPGARAGLAECLERMFEVEVQGENEDAARALLAEIGARDDLAEKLRALGARLDQRRSAEGRLRKLEHDRDLTVGAGERRVFFAVVLAFGLVLVAVPHFQPGGPKQLGHDDIILFDGVVLSVLTAMILIARRRLLQNAIGYQVVGTFVAIAVASLVNRLFGARFGTPIPAVLVSDMLLIAVSSAVGGMMFHRGMLWWVGLSLLGAALAAVYPDAASDFHGGLMVLILALAMGLRKTRAPTATG